MERCLKLLKSTTKKTPENGDFNLVRFENKGKIFYPPIRGKKFRGANDFKKLGVLGEGTFGVVYLVKKKDNGNLYAMKVVNMANIKNHQDVYYHKTERLILQCVDSPFIVKMDYAFKSNNNLYFVMEFVPGGDMFDRLKKCLFISEDCVKLYMAELFLALRELHSKKIIYRDMKPENILIDSNGHLKLADFGLSKISAEGRTYSLCGSMEYIAPEIVSPTMNNRSSQGYSESVDWWSFGVVMFELLYGVPPFYDDDYESMFRGILENDIEFPDQYVRNHVSDVAKDLLTKLLEKDPKKRITENEIMKHPFFEPLDFDDVMKMKYKMEYIPKKKKRKRVFVKPKMNKDTESICNKLFMEFKNFDYSDSPMTPK